MKRVVIVGAGISGLALAYRLGRVLPDAELTVLERDSRPGGKIWTERQNGFQVEIGPNGFLDNKPSTLDLCRDLGLGDQLQRASAASGKNRYLLLNGRLRRLPNDLTSFLRSDLLSWRGKLAVLAEFLRPRAANTRESIDAFVRRRLGREAAEVIADALVTGIHAGDPTLLSVRAAFPRMAEAEDRYGSLFRGFNQMARRRRAEAASRGQPYERAAMWSFGAGLRLLVETLVRHLPQPPRLGVTVRRIERHDSAWTVRGEGSEAWQADAVILACPAYQQAALLADLDAPLADRIGGIAYNRVAVVALGFRQQDVPTPLDGFGFIAPQRTRRDLLGVQWCSSIFPARAPAGAVLLRALCGGWNRPEVVGWEDARLLDAVRSELRHALGIVAVPVFHHIVRWDKAIPQYLLGHPERVAEIEERVRRHAGLFLAGNAYHGVALNDCTEQAAVLAERVRTYLGEPGGARFATIPGSGYLSPRSARSLMQSVLSLILGGGRGTRLYPLTMLRSKPAVPIAGKYRLIDIPISNCLNSGLNRIYVLTQFLSVSLHRHIANTYKFDPFSRGFVEVLAAQQTNEAADWYQGTADAVRQNIRYVHEDGCKEVLILSGDQLYRMDFRALIQTHRDSRANATLAVLPVSQRDATACGIMQLDDTGRVVGFKEKPQTEAELNPLRTPADWIERRGIASRGRQFLASMGIYLFNRETLFELLNEDPPAKDFGKEIFPRSIQTHHVQAHLFDGYWEDLGTIRSYHEASLALAGENPPFDFHSTEGVIYTRMRFLPASRVSAANLDECLVSDGCVVESGTQLTRCVLGVRSRIGKNAVLRDTVMIGADRFETDAERAANRERGTPDVGIGEGSVIQQAILDKDCRIGRNVCLVNRENVQNDEGTNYVIRDGIIVIPKGVVVPDGTVI